MHGACRGLSRKRRGKKIPRLLLLFLLFFLFLGITPLFASAEEYENTEQEEAAVRDFFASLPDLGIEDPLSKEGNEALLDRLGIEYLFSLAVDSLSGELPSAFATLSTLLGIGLLLSLTVLLREKLSVGVGKVLDGVLSITLVLFLYDRFSGVFRLSEAFLTDLCVLSDLFAPLMASLYLAGGNTASATVGGGALFSLSLLLENLGAKVLMPLLRLLLGFLLVSAVGEIRTDGLVSSLKNLYTTLLSFGCMLTGAALSFQSVLGNAADSFTLRTVKFAVGNMIPTVGGTVSGGLSALASSISFLRATAGGGVCAVLFASALPSLVGLLLSRLCLSLSASFFELLGVGSPYVRLLRAFRALFDLCLAAVALSFMLFIFIAAVFMKSRVALGG